MSEILNQATSRPAHRVGWTWLTASAAGLMVLGAAAFGTAPDTVIYPGRYNDVLEQVALQAAQPISPDNNQYVREVRIQRGDTVSDLLAGMDISDQETLAQLLANRDADALFRQLAPGKVLTAHIDTDGSLHSLLFPLNGGKGDSLLIERHAEGFSTQIQSAQPNTSISLQTAIIRNSLFGAADDAGIPDAVAVQLADIFGGDIDFHRDLRKGDRFSVIYESVTDQTGKPLGTQRILAAEFVNDGKTFRAFWFQDKERGGYYTADGQSLKKAFLRSPLEFSRITSGFTNARLHPILQKIRAHRGIDYGAPIGTRVKATGDGIIEFAGSKGGYGKVVMIRHPGNRKTVYGHLSGFASGLRQGSRVSQGEIIGYVGMTGMATGPHLHYEFQVAGAHRNPLEVILPPAPPLSIAQQKAFQPLAAERLTQLTSIRDLQLVMLD